jgi:hypothetical protein
MLFMNEMEIQETVSRTFNDPVMRAGALTLRELSVAVDQMSDGWAHWPAPARAAKQLMEILTGRKQFNSEKELVQALRKSLTPIRSFKTKHKLNFEIFVIPDAT